MEHVSKNTKKHIVSTKFIYEQHLLIHELQTVG
jgi:hypothetical protein